MRRMLVWFLGATCALSLLFVGSWALFARERMMIDRSTGQTLRTIVIGELGIWVEQRDTAVTHLLSRPNALQPSTRWVLAWERGPWIAPSHLCTTKAEVLSLGLQIGKAAQFLQFGAEAEAALAARVATAFAAADAKALKQIMDELDAELSRNHSQRSRREEHRMATVVGVLFAYLLAAAVVFDFSEAAYYRDAEYNQIGQRFAIGPRPRWFICYPTYSDFFYEGDEWPFKVFAPICTFHREFHGYALR